MSAILQSALEYASFGWKVVLLHAVNDDKTCSCSQGKACKGAGKHPRLKDWPSTATDDEEVISGWLEQHRNTNIGILLGESSGIIDIECDTPEAEVELVKLFGGEVIPCPTYSSGRGKHRLFKFRLGLPGKNEAVSKPGNIGLELRTGYGAKGAQSVFPPSRHLSGSRYRWLPGLSPSEIDPPEIPESVITGLWELDQMERPDAPNERPAKKDDKFYEGDTVKETVDGRDDHLISLAGKEIDILVRGHGLSALAEPHHYNRLFNIINALNVTTCQPPLEQSEVRKKLDQAIRMARKSDAANPVPERFVEFGLALVEGEFFPGEWRASCVKSDPPKIRLFAPMLPDGSILLSTEAFDSPREVHRAVLKATGSICLSDIPGKWETIWNGQSGKNSKAIRGLKAKLLDIADSEKASVDEHRQGVIAEHVLDLLERAQLHDEEKQLPNNGTPVLMSDGSVYFKINYLFNKIRFEDIQRNEISAILEKCCAAEVYPRVNGKSKRYRAATNECIMMLRQLAGLSDYGVTTNPPPYREENQKSISKEKKGVVCAADSSTTLESYGYN